MSCTVTEALETGFIPSYLKKIIPTHCSCGSDLIILDTNTKAIRCSDPLCPVHMSMRADSMLKDLKISDIGPGTCQKMIMEQYLSHHTQIFSLGLHQMPSRNSEEVRLKYYNNIHQVDKLPLSDVAKLLREMNMAGRCDDIFSGYDNIDKFYKDFNYSEDFISNKLQMKKGITTRAFTQYLTQDEALLRALCSKFKIKKTSTLKLTICMTGDIMTVKQPSGANYRSREVFINDMREILEGKIEIATKTSVSSKVELLVTDTPNSNTRKNRDADSFGIPKLTFKQFQERILTYAERKLN